jgi:hypothetical protein
VTGAQRMVIATRTIRETVTIARTNPGRGAGMTRAARELILWG